MESVVNLSRKEQVIRSAAALFKEKGTQHLPCGISPKNLVLKLPACTHTSSRRKRYYRLFALIWPLSFAPHSIRLKLKKYPPRKKLTLGIIGHVHVMAKDLTASAVFMNEHRHLSQPYLRDFLFLRINYINRFKKIIEEGVQAGEFKKNIDTKLAVMTLFSSLNWMPLWYSPSGSIEPKELGQQLADMLVNGLKQN